MNSSEPALGPFQFLMRCRCVVSVDPFTLLPIPNTGASNPHNPQVCTQQMPDHNPFAVDEYERVLRVWQTTIVSPPYLLMEPDVAYRVVEEQLRLYLPRHTPAQMTQRAAMDQLTHEGQMVINGGGQFVVPTQPASGINDATAVYADPGILFENLISHGAEVIDIALNGGVIPQQPQSEVPGPGLVDPDVSIPEPELLLDMTELLTPVDPDLPPFPATNQELLQSYFGPDPPSYSGMELLDYNTFINLDQTGPQALANDELTAPVPTANRDSGIPPVPQSSPAFECLVQNGTTYDEVTEDAKL